MTIKHPHLLLDDDESRKFVVETVEPRTIIPTQECQDSIIFARTKVLIKDQCLEEMPDLFHGLVEEGDDGVCLEGVLVERDVEQLQEQVRVAVVLRQRRLKRRPRARTVPQLQTHEAGVPANGRSVI